MSTPPLACTVRGCADPLSRHAQTWACRRGHVYDIARSGYVNLLQPQDRKSLQAGDHREAVEARARLIADGVGQTLITAVTDLAAALDVGERLPVVAELGSGAGDLLHQLGARRPVTAVGIDLSTTAADLSARRFPSLIWVVANADRRLPLLDRSVHLLISVHARRNPPECARVLVPSGALIVAVPAPDDLIELRTVTQGTGVERDRVEVLIAEHAAHFTVVRRTVVREHPRLQGDVLRDLLRATYRGSRRSAAEHVESLEQLDVTLASDLVLFRKR